MILKHQITPVNTFYSLIPYNRTKMAYAIRTIKPSSSIVWVATCTYEKHKCLAVSRGKYLEIYSLNMKLHNKKQTHGFLSCMQSMKYKETDALLLLSSNYEYTIISTEDPGLCILNRGFIIQEHVLDSQPYAKHGSESYHYKHIRSTDNLIVIVHRSNLITTIHTGSTGLYINEIVSAHEIIDVCIGNNEVFMLVRDGSESSVITYLKKETKLVYSTKYAIPNDAYKLCCIETNLLAIALTRIMVLMGKRIISETLFANPEALCYASHGRGIILGMSNGELIGIQLENSLKIKLLGQLKSPINFIIGGLKTPSTPSSYLNEKSYFIGSYHSNSYYITLGEELRINDVYYNQGEIKSMINKIDHIYFLSKNENSLMYHINAGVLNTYEVDGPIKGLWRIGSYIIISFIGASYLMHEKTSEIIKSYEEILGVEKGNGSNLCYYHTSNQISIMDNNLDCKSRITEPILHASYYKGKCVIYTKRGYLEIILLSTLNTLYTTVFTEEISHIRYYKEVFVCTYEKGVCVFDKKLKLTRKINAECIRNSCLIDSDGSDIEKRLVFVDTNGNIYNSMFNIIIKTGEYIRAIYSLDSPDPNIINILAIGKYSILISFDALTEKYNIYRFGINDITALGYGKNGQYYLASHSNIYLCKPDFKPTFNVYSPINDINDARFVIEHKKNKIVGWIKRENDIYASYIACYHENKAGETIKFKNQIIVDGLFIDRNYFAIGINTCKSSESKIMLYELVDNFMVKKYDVEKNGSIFVMDGANEYIVTSHGNILTVYKATRGIIVELASIQAEILPWSIKIDGDGRIIVGDLLRTFSVYKFDDQINVIEEVEKFNHQMKIECVEFIDKGYISCSNGNIFILKDGKRLMTSYNENITSIVRYSYSHDNKNECYYFGTECGSIGVLKDVSGLISDSEYKRLMELQEQASIKSIFLVYSDILNMDLINNEADNTIRDLII
ncbi:hypothetical protein TCON_0161 [Astathelohania contejeani]|uniref:RSE1/DDB1/CPSF1 C-terminal domain-containing protein n=1 Tax=Astathelohania contejeani TaxID=164912 RepID=A0ABQ7I2H7_9MICR|nr:hypothetical protein TCON_0161 [Thelohania contejeani]